MPSAQRREIAQRVERTLDLLCVAVIAREHERRFVELVGERARGPRFGTRIIDQRPGKNDVEKGIVVEIVTMADDAERGNHVLADRILSQCAALSEAAGQSSGEESRFGEIPDLVLTIKERKLAPGERVCLTVATQILD